MSAEKNSLLTLDNINPCVIKLQYAVRGPLVIRASEIEKEMEKGVQKPFKAVVKANIGDAHAMGQKPITFIRQVLALVAHPELLKDPAFPADAKRHADTILKACRGYSVGSYTDSPGIEVIREHVAQYITKRDGFPCSSDDIILSNGASDGIKSVLRLLICTIDGKQPGVMIPIPQYPLYSASLAEFNIHQIGYFLDESKGWGINNTELERALNESKTKHNINPRAIVVINPGNPTGQVLTKENIQNIIKFAFNEKLLILADEVYQHNVYAKGSEFHSFKKVMKEMGEPYSSMELASFMSISKGYMGECGVRGGYTEITNFHPQVKAQLLKYISANLCSTVFGQTVMDCVVNSPQKGDPSYDLFEKEKNAVLGSLKDRAKLIYDTFNSIPGYSCNEVQGAMYAFPRVEIPEKAIEIAKQNGQQPDVFYAFQLLEATGICIIPGSGFGQKAGTYHFRTTILPQTDKLKEMLNHIKEFHVKFLKEYS
ncbi:alanine aminotransferase 2-like isoform X2 [Chrysoperla carnea]|uniref:alanine aminotransferase 2-like isoform X2 n=1 Tax=Chrysoperla carnea TaxID=189513 RepID=UPI001D065666|nr:alanine aminotransferase 2-like isoform X2 [Chrysoperla carnea]